MDLFGIKKRKATKAAAKAYEEKVLARVKEEYKILKNRADTLYIASEEYLKSTAEFVNNTCPICKSKNVNDRIQRLQGEFKGSISGSRSLFGGSLSGRSRGSIDTNEVNKCNDCGHEWKKYKACHRWPSTIMESGFEHLLWLLEDYKDAINAKIDKYDLDEEYLSDQEKKVALLKKLREGYRLKNAMKFFTGISIESIKTIAIREIWKSDSGTANMYIDKLEKNWDEKFLEDYLQLKHVEV